MSSVFEIPQALALAISLAVSPAESRGEDDVLSNTIPLVASSPAIMGRQSYRRFVRGQDFQFNRQSWLSGLTQAREIGNIDRYAARIFKTNSGRYYVPIKSEREAILALGRDAKNAFALAGAVAVLNRKKMKTVLKRNPTAGELYIAHLFGLRDAIRFIRIARRDRRLPAAPHFSALAFAHTGLFFSSRRARTAGEVYRMIQRSIKKSSRSVSSGTKQRFAVQVTRLSRLAAKMHTGRTTRGKSAAAQVKRAPRGRQKVAALDWGAIVTRAH